MKHLVFTLRTIGISLLTLGFALLLWHFSVSNFSYTVGGNYAWESTSDYVGHPFYSGVNCGVDLSEVYESEKGFPFQINNNYGPYCGVATTKPVETMIAVTLNVIYILVACGLYYLAIIKLLGRSVGHPWKRADT